MIELIAIAWVVIGLLIAGVIRRQAPPELKLGWRFVLVTTTLWPFAFLSGLRGYMKKDHPRKGVPM